MAQTQIFSVVRISLSAQCGNFCVAADDGEAIFALIKSALEAGKSVALSFAGVESLSTAFLNSAIGELLEIFSEDELNAHLKVEEISPANMGTLRRVIANAKRYYADPIAHQAMRREMEMA